MAPLSTVVCPKCNLRVLPRSDGTCPSCGNVLSQPQSSIAQEPANVAALEQKNSTQVSRVPERLLSSMDTPPEKETKDLKTRSPSPAASRQSSIRLAIEHAVWPNAIFTDDVGDLLFVGRDMYFICYYSVIKKWAWLFGMISWASISFLGKALPAGSVELTYRIRKGFYGLSLDERMEQLPHSEVIRNLAKVKYISHGKSATVICTSIAGEELDLRVPIFKPSRPAAAGKTPEGWGFSLSSGGSLWVDDQGNLAKSIGGETGPGKGRRFGPRGRRIGSTVYDFFFSTIRKAGAGAANRAGCQPPRRTSTISHRNPLYGCTNKSR